MLGELAVWGGTLFVTLFLIVFVPLALAVAVVTGLRHPAPPRPPRVDEAVDTTSEPTAGMRRCEDCKRRWEGSVDQAPSTLRLRLARSARRRARIKAQPPPEWARAQGWDRCPSCLSRNVRMSRMAGRSSV